MLHVPSWSWETADLPPPRMRRISRCRGAMECWLLAASLWLGALAAQWWLGTVVDSFSFLAFIPAIALITLFCGRLPAGTAIAATAVACDYFWLPPGGFDLEWPATPASLAVLLLVGTFELCLVDALYRAARPNRERERGLERALRLRETMFQELRYRVSDQLGVITAMLEGSQIEIGAGARVDDVLEQAIGRIASITHLQRIVDDRPGCEHGFAPLIHRLLDHIIYDVDVAVQVRSRGAELSDEQMTIVSLIVIEAAMNSLKHIFRRRRGHLFAVELRDLPQDRLALTIWDDGPGFDTGVLVGSIGLGLSIMRGLAAELGGSVSLRTEGGTTVQVEFPAKLNPAAAGSTIG